MANVYIIYNIAGDMVMWKSANLPRIDWLVTAYIIIYYCMAPPQSRDYLIRADSSLSYKSFYEYRF